MNDGVPAGNSVDGVRVRCIVGLALLVAFVCVEMVDISGVMLDGGYQ